MLADEPLGPVKLVGVATSARPHVPGLDCGDAPWDLIATNVFHFLDWINRTMTANWPGDPAEG